MSNALIERTKFKVKALLELRRFTHLLQENGGINIQGLTVKYGINLNIVHDGKLLLSEVIEGLEESLAEYSQRLAVAEACGEIEDENNI